MRYLLIVLLLASCYFSIFAGNNSEKNRESIPLTGVESIEIYTSSGDIDIRTEDRDDIYLDLKTYDKGPKLFIDRGRTLVIEVKKTKFRLFEFNSKQVKLTVILPKKYIGNLKTESSSGDVNLSDMYLYDMDIELSSGDLTTEQIEAKNAKLTSSSGDITIKQLKVEELKVSLSSGSLEIEDFTGSIKGSLSSGSVELNINELVGDIDLDLSSGSAEIDFREKNLNAELELRTSSGEIEVDFPIVVKGKQKDNRLTGTTGNGKYKINISCSSGDISLY